MIDAIVDKANPTNLLRRYQGLADTGKKIVRTDIPKDLLPAFQDAMRSVLREDLDVYEAQQKCIDLDPEAVDRDANPKGMIPADAALLQMRRVIRRLHGAESGAGWAMMRAKALTRGPPREDHDGRFGSGGRE